MSLLSFAKNFVSAKWFSQKITTQAWAGGNTSLPGGVPGPFVIPQGPLTITRPIGFAPNGFYVDDLELFLTPGQSQDLGALFTQRQLNESGDLKEALVLADLTYDLTGTVPINDPTGVVVTPIIQVKNSGGTLINPATEDTLLLVKADLDALAAASAPPPYNVYGANTVPGGGVETVILTATILVGTTALIETLVAWGDVDASYLLKVDGVIVAGGRTSISEPTLDLNYGKGSIVVKATTVNRIITVTAQQFSNSAHELSANIAGGLV